MVIDRKPAANGLVGSRGRVGACGDDAATGSFFALLPASHSIVKATLQQPGLTRTSLRQAGVAEVLYETGVSSESLPSGYATVRGYERTFGLREGVHR
jgi:hypothetical protein